MANFNYNPAPQVGQGIYGKVPGAIGAPQPFSDLAALYPNLSNTNAAASGLIASKLRGELSPDTISALQDDAARFGITSGMPGSGLANNRYFGGLINARENLQEQGLQDYNRILPTISGTQTVTPQLQTDIAERNALYGSAPDPQAAQTYAQQLYENYLRKLGGPGGGTGDRGKPYMVNDAGTGQSYMGFAPTGGY